MHVIRDRQTRQVLHIDSGESVTPLPGEDVFAGFDATRMEIGWTPRRYIPAYFDIDADGHVIELSLSVAAGRGLHRLASGEKLENGVIVPKNDDELVADGVIDLDTVKLQLLEACTKASLELRAKLIPDYKLQNAALGVYDEEKVGSFRATVDAFRAEVHRLERQIENAKTLGELRSIAPKFPDRVLTVER